MNLHVSTVQAATCLSGVLEIKAWSCLQAGRYWRLQDTFRMGRRDGMRQGGCGNRTTGVLRAFVLRRNSNILLFKLSLVLEPPFRLLQCHWVGASSPSLRGTLLPSSSFPCTCP